MSDHTPFEPRPEDERRRRFRPSGFRVDRIERVRPARVRGCRGKRTPERLRGRRRMVKGCPRGL